MSDVVAVWWLLHAPLGAVVGFALGAGYFASLQRTAAVYVSAAPAWRAIVLTLLRVAIALLVFAALARWSALAAVGGLVGFTAARQWMVSQARRG